MKSNSQLQKDVLNELLWEPKLRAAQIGVTANNGIVTLSGYASNYLEKKAAEEAALRVAGVAGLAEDIEIKIPGSSERSDTDIAEAAVNALKWHVLVPEDKVKVRVDDGWVMLTGQVDWWFQLNEARKCVEGLAGVRGITNRLDVSPTVKPAEIKTKIESAMERSAELQAKGIQVENTGDKVILRGSVDSWSAYKDAERAAWSAPGVHKVENKILVQDASYVES
jgi:osmotically-inducible protein OsmY